MANRRENNDTEVRGPTSALTAFLRSKNIRVTNTDRFRRREEAAAAADALLNGEAPAEGAAADAVPLPSSPAQASPSASPGAVARRSAPARRVRSSMNFEEDDASDEEAASIPVSKRGRMSKEGAAVERGEGSSQRVASSSVTPATPTLGTSSLRQTALGALDFCAMCSKRFAITAYTRHTHAGGLCHRCGPTWMSGGSAGTSNGSAASTLVTPLAGDAPVPKRGKARRKPNQFDVDKNRLPSLQSMCINIIANNIEDVEALIGINGQNMDSISKSISKNRRLNGQTAMLFLTPAAKRLSFYDCSQMNSEALASITRFVPYVEEINLQLCGMLDNDAIDEWSLKLKRLAKVELYGPFLVRKESWHRFFTATGDRLTSFKIRESPRFDKSCCEKLVECCPNLTELGLAQIGPLNAECLAVLQTYGQQLTYLDVSDPGVSAPGVPPMSLKDDEVVDLLKHVGPRLAHLDISRNADLTHRTLLDGILANCISLRTLKMVLMQDETIEAEHFIKLFAGLKERGGARLTHVDLERCFALDDEGVAALVDFSGPALEELNINSCERITAAGFATIAKGCPNLHTINVGFCRQVTDDVVMDLINSIRTLRTVYVFGCNKVTPYVRAVNVRIYGKEKYA